MGEAKRRKTLGLPPKKKIILILKLMSIHDYLNGFPLQSIKEIT
jgi:hypothetical protein